MGKAFERYKWVGLLAFSLLYNMVYLGRFNLNYSMSDLAVELDLTTFQQNLIATSVFISYAAGSFFNGYIADRYGPKKVILMGASISAVMNLCIAFQYNWIAILCCWIVNGYFQSMIWVGGISMLSHWWQEGERGKGVGIANFFSGMSHATAYLLPLGLLTVWPTMEWRMNLIFPMFALLLFAYGFGLLGVERPEAKRLAPYKEKNTRVLAKEWTLQSMAREKELPWMYFLKQKKFLWWCGIAMTSSICRYGLLNWIPLYFMEGGDEPILSETFSNLTLPMGMAFGTLIITWVAGTKLIDNKGIIVTAMAALCGTLVVAFPVINSTTSVLVGIFFTGFALYGINGILWLYAIDEGCRVFAGSAAGILNAFAYLGAALEGFVFPVVLNNVDSKLSVFVVMEILCILMVIMGMIVSRKNTVVMPEVRE